jgi:hypothetical protein
LRFWDDIVIGGSTIVLVVLTDAALEGTVELVLGTSIIAAFFVAMRIAAARGGRQKIQSQTVRDSGPE